MPVAAEMYMNHERYVKYSETTGQRSAVWRKKYCLVPAALRRFPILALLMAGSIFLAGCSAGRDSEPEWSFQAEQEGMSGSGGENAEAREQGAQTGGGDSGSAENTAENAGVLSGEGTMSADSGSVENTAGNTKVLPEADGTGTGGSAIQNPVSGYVYVCGAVANPGVYQIGEGTRVFEVIEQAGGLTGQADAEWMNQAEVVLDGQKLQIYTKEETAAFKEAGLPAPDGMNQGTVQGTDPQMSAGDGGSTVAQEAAGDDRVNINTADRDLLMTLPGIGESKAEAILQYRQEHGGFGSIGDICQVSGIKEAVFSRIKDRITV